MYRPIVFDPTWSQTIWSWSKVIEASPISDSHVNWRLTATLEPYDATALQNQAVVMIRRCLSVCRLRWKCIVTRRRLVKLRRAERCTLNKLFFGHWWLHRPMFECYTKCYTSIFTVTSLAPLFLSQYTFISNDRQTDSDVSWQQLDFAMQLHHMAQV